MADRITFRKDQALPSLGLRWEAADGTARDFSSGWTFAAKLVDEAGVTVLTKTSGIVGASTFPNITITFALADWSTLTASTAGTPYQVRVYPTRISDGLPDLFDPGEEPILYLLPAS